MKKDRIEWIDSLKGFTIITVIIGHCLVGYLEAGMFEAQEYVFSQLKWFVYSFHMPLFFIISGITLLLAYVKENDNGNELKREKYFKQTLNLFVVYFIWALILWTCKMIFSQYTNVKYDISRLLDMFILPLGNYWYLYVLCAIYIIVFLFKLYNKKTMYFALPITLIISCVAVYLSNNYELQFTIYRIAFNLFFVVLGIAICMYPKIIDNIYVFISSLVISITLLVAYFVFDIDTYYLTATRALLALSISLVFIYLFKHIKFLNNKFLNFCGKYCVYIYIVHFYITAGNRKILPMLHINTPYLSLIINAVSALAISLLVACVAIKVPISDILFRPVKFIDRINHKLRREYRS